MASIGDRIVFLRKRLNITQKDLAIKVGITEASLSRYENNLREPKAEIISKLAANLETTTDYLLGQAKDHTKSAKIETKSYQNLDVGGLSEEAIRQVEEYIEFIKQKHNPDGTLKKK